MAMTARQSEALRDLTTRGVLSADQESAVRAALEDTGAPPRVADRVAELAAYVGGGLVLGGAARIEAQIFVVATERSKTQRFDTFTKSAIEEEHCVLFEVQAGKLVHDVAQ